MLEEIKLMILNKKQIATINNHYLEKIEKKEREKQVMIDLWYLKTNGKQFILKSK